MNEINLEDCRDTMSRMADNSVDSIVTDPPYELGFMGKDWDNTGIAYDVDMWAECLRVLKPGGYLMAFSATRTYHRMAVAIEDAGFEIRDMIEWVYGSGFPKSLNIGKAVDKRGGTTSDQSKEFAEYIKNRRNELNITLSKADEVICGGTTNYSWFEGRPAGQRLPRKADYLKMKELLKLDDRYNSFMEETEREVVGKNTNCGTEKSNGESMFGIGAVGKEVINTKGTSEYEGWGTALKPAHEPICMARKPLSEKTVAENVIKWGTGGINVDESRISTNESTMRPCGKALIGTFEGQEGKISGSYAGQGRFPANLIHDNSEEVRECFPETKPATSRTTNKTIGVTNFKAGEAGEVYNDSGNASRFFKSIIYQAKASKSERGETNNHPTVKPIALMEYLIKMVTKPNGIVYDPFGGSGTTACACILNGYSYILSEMEADHVEIIKARTEHHKQKHTQATLF